jgi:hypothetical protein
MNVRNLIGQLKEKKKTIFFLFALLLFSMIYILNMIYPLFAEDWDYSFIWTPDGPSSGRVESITDIIISQYRHYIWWGGRSVVHAIDQILLLSGEGWADLINSLIFLLFIYLIYKISNYKKELSLSVFVAIFLLFWFFQPSFFDTVIWITGSANYLWGTLLSVSLMYPYYIHFRKYTDEIGKKDSVLLIFIIFVLGVLAGWTNENIGIALVIYILLIFVLLKKEHKKIHKWMISGLIGVLIGSLILLSAPGNYIRMNAANHFWSAMPILDLILYKTIFLSKIYIKNILILSIIYLFFFTLVLKGKNENKKNICINSLLFFVSAHIAFMAMFFSPIFPERAAFGIISFLIIGISILYANINLKTIYWRVTNLITIFIISILFFYTYYERYTYLVYANDFWKKREAYVIDQKKKGIKDIIFKDRFKEDEHFELYDVSENDTYWINTVYARYFGVNSVKISDAENK